MLGNQISLTCSYPSGEVKEFLRGVLWFCAAEKNYSNESKELIKPMDEEVNTIDVCNLLNLEMDDDWKGASGEDTAKAILVSLPIFRVVFMGEKYPVTDFYVEIASDKEKPYPFLVQVKTTTSELDEHGRLCVSVPHDKFVALCKRPIPTYVGGVNLNDDTLFIRPAFDASEHVSFIEPHMVLSKKNKLDCGQKLLAIKRDVINYWDNLRPREYKQSYKSFI